MCILLKVLEVCLVFLHSVASLGYTKIDSICCLRPRLGLGQRILSIFVHPREATEWKITQQVPSTSEKMYICFNLEKENYNIYIGNNIDCSFFQIIMNIIFFLQIETDVHYYKSARDTLGYIPLCNFSRSNEDRKYSLTKT